MSRILSILQKLKPEDYRLIIRLYFDLHQAKWQIERNSLKQIVKWIRQAEITEKTVDKVAFAYAKKVVRYTDRLSKYTLYKSKCYDQALAVKQELNRKKIPSALIMGVNTNPGNDLKAHAWIRCGEEIIIGGMVAEDYTAIRHFY